MYSQFVNHPEEEELNTNEIRNTPSSGNEQGMPSNAEEIRREKANRAKASFESMKKNTENARKFDDYSLYCRGSSLYHEIRAAGSEDLLVQLENFENEYEKNKVVYDKLQSLKRTSPVTTFIKGPQYQQVLNEKNAAMQAQVKAIELFPFIDINQVIAYLVWLVFWILLVYGFKFKQGMLSPFVYICGNVIAMFAVADILLKLIDYKNANSNTLFTSMVAAIPLHILYFELVVRKQLAVEIPKITLGDTLFFLYGDWIFIILAVVIVVGIIPFVLKKGLAAFAASVFTIIVTSAMGVALVDIASDYINDLFEEGKFTVLFDQVSFIYLLCLVAVYLMKYCNTNSKNKKNELTQKITDAENRRIKMLQDHIESLRKPYRGKVLDRYLRDMDTPD